MKFVIINVYMANNSIFFCTFVAEKHIIECLIKEYYL